MLVFVQTRHVEGVLLVFVKVSWAAQAQSVCNDAAQELPKKEYT